MVIQKIQFQLNLKKYFYLKFSDIWQRSNCFILNHWSITPNNKTLLKTVQATLPPTARVTEFSFITIFVALNQFYCRARKSFTLN